MKSSVKQQHEARAKIIKGMHEKSIFPLLSAVIKEHKIHSTPTCIIKYGTQGVKEYVGDDKIWNGLNQFKEYLSTGRK
jgi:hypothetical protein